MLSKFKFILLIAILLPLPSFAKSLNIAIVLDGDKPFAKGIVEIVESEIRVLLNNDVKMEFRVMHSSFDENQYTNTLESAYGASDIDMVVVLGIGTTQTALVNRRYVKPTFLPNLFAAQFYGLPTENGSGIRV